MLNVENISEKYQIIIYIYYIEMTETIFQNKEQKFKNHATFKK